MPYIENGRIVESATESRAGVTCHKVRFVLLFSTLGVIALFSIIYIYFFD